MSRNRRYKIRAEIESVEREKGEGIYLKEITKK